MIQLLWKDQYKIGVELIDKQHQELFKRLNSFLIVLRNGKPLEEKMDEIEKTFGFMGEYVDVHFKSEEALQKKVKYPGYEAHHKIHEKFKQDIVSFKKEFEKDKYNEDLIMEFSGRLLTWLINHVTGEDQNIAKYVPEGGVKVES
ncbi:MAG: hemerythrin family protein [Thermotogota bacterium]|nr:hemerythrin family protein [Thermotogota bacterium]